MNKKKQENTINIEKDKEGEADGIFQFCRKCIAFEACKLLHASTCDGYIDESVVRNFIKESPAFAKEIYSIGLDCLDKNIKMDIGDREEKKIQILATVNKYLEQQND